MSSDRLEFARLMLGRYKKKLKRSKCHACRMKVMAQLKKWRAIVAILESEIQQ